LTRAKIAQNAVEENKRERNRVEVWKAYHTVLHFLPDTSLFLEEKKEIDSKLMELKFVLHSLGRGLIAWPVRE
jgi:hypothetical protein